MTVNHRGKSFQKLGLAAAVIIFALSLFFRFYAINQPNFFLFDEGYYLKFNYKFVKALAEYPPHGFIEFWKAFYTLIRFSLGTGKPLWFVLVDGRGFWGASEDWSFPRIVSAIVGVLTLFATYRFAKKFFQSKPVAILSVVILSILPSHVFYSRLALQEALSGLLFLLGFDSYLLTEEFGFQTFISSVFFVGAYLSNYRLIFIPALTAMTEIYRHVISSGNKNSWKPVFRKYLWHTLIFFAGVLIIGSMDRAQNMNTIYAWTFHQADLAQVHMDWFNFFSYPYYLFTLESFALGTLFFANVYLIVRKEWQYSFPFLLSLLLMGIFSLTSDRAVRYLCVALPFIAMAVAFLIVFIFEKEKRIPKTLTIAGTIFLILSLIPKTASLALAHSDYKSSVEFLRRGDPKARILSTQPWIQKLFVTNENDVMPAPYGFRRLIDWYLKGYHYVIVDPQSYISYTFNGEKFDLRLKGCLGIIDSHLKPIKVFPHFNSAILERIVFEHNENLGQSISFLNNNRERLGTLRIYDTTGLVTKLAGRFSASHQENYLSRASKTEEPAANDFVPLESLKIDSLAKFPLNGNGR